MAELKTCPFCGGEAKKIGQQMDNLNYVYVVCTKCGASGPIWHVHNPRVPDKDNPAILNWNNRV